MAENKKGDVFENDDEMSFEELFNSYDSKMGKELNQGDKVDGQIISIGKKSIYIDTGTKSDGVVEKSELLDEKGELPYAVGDRVSLFVVSTSESEIILSKAVSGAGQAMMLNEAKASGTPVEGKVSAVIKGGFHVELMGKRAFCPVSQIDVKYVETPEDYVGQTLHFLITRIEEGGRNIVVSRRDLLEEQLEDKRREFFEKTAEGDVIKGTVSKLMGFGAFIELAPGIEGMAHISELSWSRVEKAEDVVRVGETVTVKILKIEDAKEARNKKLSLSLKQVSANPWDNASSLFHTGEQVSGRVVRMTSFGAFVEIAPGVDGLVHISEMSHTKRVLRPEDVVRMGEEVQVIVKSIDPEAKRISLSIKDAAGDPWTGASLRYPEGSVVEGVMEKREAFGLFINLEPGVTGLLPGSHIREASDSSVFDSLKPGDKVMIMVHTVDEENRKLTLASPDQKEGGDWKQFSGSGEKGVFGSMGDLLRQAMDEKNKKKK